MLGRGGGNDLSSTSICPVSKLWMNLVWYKIGPLRGGSSGASVRGPESQERVSESLKFPMDLAIDVLFWYFQQWKCSYLPRHEGQIFDNFKIFLSISH
jgi:hypothetical protein